MAMNEGMKDVTFITHMIKELSGHMLRPELIIDCKDVWDTLQSTTAPTDKRVRCEASSVRESLLEKEVSRVVLVKGKSQLADVLTKRKMQSLDFLQIVQSGDSLTNLGYKLRD